MAVARRLDARADESTTYLLERCRSGDEKAWIALVRRYERLVYSVPIREGLCADTSAEVAQHTFTVLFRSMDAICDPEQLSYWLMTVARREVWRRRRKDDPLLKLEELEIEPEPEDDWTDYHAEIAWVHDAVQRLPEPCQSVVIRLFLDPDEPSYEQVAQLVSRPVGSIGPLRSRCLSQLRRTLEGGLHGGA